MTSTGSAAPAGELGPVNRAASSWNDAAAYDCGLDSVIGTPSLTERGISRSLGMKIVGLGPEHGHDVVVRDADAACRRG